MRPVLSVLLACTMMGCIMTSRPVSESARARTAAGVPASITLVSGPTITGELLAMDAQSVTLLAAKGVTVVPSAAIRYAAFEGYPGLFVEKGLHGARRTVWERVQLESRYPYGIPAPALAAIMQSRQQARVDTVAVP